MQNLLTSFWIFNMKKKNLKNLFDKVFKSVQKFYLGRRILGSGGSKIKVGA